jgi:uncharacterized membrane protein YhaH (DUF805 family)
MRELNPVQWAVLPLKKYADFSGRAPRAEYWWFYLGSTIVSFGLGIVGPAIIGGMFSLAVFVPSLAVTVRRLHDIDRTGWWMLAFVGVFAIIGAMGVVAGLNASGLGSQVPMEGSFTFMVLFVVAAIAIGITMLVFMITEGTQGDNRYGPDPYGPDNLEQVFA